MKQPNQTLRVTPGATSSSNYRKQHLNSLSAEELFRELVLPDHSYSHSVSGSTVLTPITTATPSSVMADRFPSLEDFAPGECLAPLQLSLLDFSQYSVKEY